MTGISFGEFYDSLYYGADIDFCYKSLFYHINAGYDKENRHNIIIYQYDRHPDYEPSYYNEIYSMSDVNAGENLEKFLNLKLFNGKCIYEICSDMEILYS